jgi:tetratricopeptide (TPR) repeat protein
MDSHDPTPAPAALAAPPKKRVLLDAAGRAYQPAVGPQLQILLAFIFVSAAVLGATGVYLGAIDAMGAVLAQSYTNQFTHWMLLAHVLVGVFVVVPFLFFGFVHLASARHRKNRVAVRLGISLFFSCIILGLSGIAMIQVDESVNVLGWHMKMPRLPTDSWARLVSYLLHALAPLAAVVLYVLHRRAGPDIKWRWGVAWGSSVGLFVLVMVGMHSQDPRKWYAKGSPEGERYFEPSKTRTVDGKFISADVLMMDQYCMKCHQDIYNDWFHSAHHLSSFNNPAYLFSVRETKKMSLARDKEVRASRWCAGCHDPVVLLSGQFDNPDYDDIKDPTAHAGITCTVCHAMVNVNSRIGNGDYTIEEPLHYPLATSEQPLLQWLNNQLVKAKPDFHKKTFLKPFHKSEVFCSTCHKVSIPKELNHYKEFLRGQNHNDTYLLSGVSGIGARSWYYPAIAKTNCAECHMPLHASNDFGSKVSDGSGERKVHNHLFPGANTGLPWLLSLEPDQEHPADELRRAGQVHADFLRGADPDGKKLRIDIFGLKAGGAIKDSLIAPLRPQLPALKPGGTYLVEVIIRTLAMGHPFTQGTADSNECWVDFQARAGDRILGRSGGMDEGEDKGRVDEWAHFVNILMLDRDGHRIDRRNPQDIFTPLYNHQIPPGAAQVVHYKLEVPADIRGPVELTVRLRYRKFDYAYMEYVYGRGKVPVLPIVDVCSDRLTLPVEGQMEPVPEQDSPIRPAWQRWNDYGIGCFLEGGADVKKGELLQAERAFRKQLDIGEPEAQGHAYLNLARVFQAEGRLSEAVDALNKAQTTEPKAPWWTVAWFRGLVNAQNGRLEDAAADFRQILDPALQDHTRKFDFTRDYVVINELGKTLFQLAQGARNDPAERSAYLREGVEWLERTLVIDPEDLDAHYWLAQCYARLGADSPISDGHHATVATADELADLGRQLADEREARAMRLQAAERLADGITAFGKAPSEPQHPKLPVLQALRTKCLPLYRQRNDVKLRAAAAAVLGQIHREAHAIFKPDELAQARTVGLYNETHPAAAHASQAIVIYPLSKRGSKHR